MNYLNALIKKIVKHLIMDFTYLEKFVKSAENFIETTSEICQNEDLKNSISENIEKLREFKNLNDQYEEKTKHHTDKSITISVPNLNQNNG